MIQDIFGLTYDNKKIKIGEYDDGFYCVGGTIFFIDSTSTATYKFYDANKQEITSVAVGDSPAYYKILTEDTNGVDKYYIYNPSLSGDRYWGYEYISTGATATAIGTGKTNTSTILAITDTSTHASNSIWSWLQEQRTNKLGGCDDWFIGSKNELEQLRLYLVENADGSSIVNFFTNRVKGVFSSSEYSDACLWVYHQSYWVQTGNKGSNSPQSCPIRSF